ncbi:hypothetical protein T03_2099, partial [Trichinella britovi]
KRDYADKFWTKCEATHHHASIKVAVAGERAQFSFDVVFGAVVALRRLYVCICGRVSKTASSGMLLVNPFVSSIGGEAQENGFVSGTKITRYKYEKTPIDNIFVSNEERMTSLTAACFTCYHVTPTNVGEHHIRLERKAKSEWKFWIEVAQDELHRWRRRVKNFVTYCLRVHQESTAYRSLRVLFIALIPGEEVAKSNEDWYMPRTILPYASTSENTSSTLELLCLQGIEKNQRDEYHCKIVDEEPYGRHPLLFIGIVKQVLNILNVASLL